MDLLTWPFHFQSFKRIQSNFCLSFWHLIFNNYFRTKKKSTKARHGKIVRLIRLLFVLIFAGFNTGFEIYNFVNKKSTSTSIVAHACGAVGGLLVGIAILKNRKVENWEIRLRKICQICIVFLVFAAVSWNIIADEIYLSAHDTTFYSSEKDGVTPENCWNKTDSWWNNCWSDKETLQKKQFKQTPEWKKLN